MKNIFNSKFLSIIILLVAVCTLLSACGGGAAKKEDVKKNVTNYDGSVNTLRQEELDSIATTLYNNVEARDAYLAAFRGYDITQKYDDYSVNHGPNYEYVQKVITKYTTK